MRILPRPMQNFVAPIRERCEPFLRYILRVQLPPEQFCKTWFPRLLKKEDVVVEVGACTGAGTKLISFLVGRAYSFEPLRANYNAVRRNLRKIGNVSIYNCAISSSQGHTNLYLNGNYSSSIVSVTGNQRKKRSVVNTTCLDKIRFDMKPTVLICDCEGAEIDVLLGSTKLVQTIRLIMVETHLLADGSNTLDVLNSLLFKLGFEATIVPTQFFYGDGSQEKWIIGSRPRAQ